MFLVPTYVAPSPIHGLGVFTAVPLTRGELVWRFEPSFDRTYSRHEFLQLPKTAQVHILKCGFLDKRTGHYVLGIDHDIFTNHSGTPALVECATHEYEVTPPLIAAYDVPAHAELTQNYDEYDDPEDIAIKMRAVSRVHAL